MERNETEIIEKIKTPKMIVEEKSFPGSHTHDETS